jgi:hypothetical protein
VTLGAAAAPPPGEGFGAGGDDAEAAGAPEARGFYEQAALAAAGVGACVDVFAVASDTVGLQVRARFGVAARGRKDLRAAGRPAGGLRMPTERWRRPTPRAPPAHLTALRLPHPPPRFPLNPPAYRAPVQRYRRLHVPVPRG